MKKKLSLIAASAILATSTVANAESMLSFTPYVGADFQYRHMNYYPNYGHNLFKHNLMQRNFYVGAKIHEYFGVEVGHQSSSSTTRTVTLGAGEIAAGAAPIQAGRRVVFNSTNRVNGLHANIIGFLPVSEEHKLKLIALVGITSLRTNFEKNVVSINGTAMNVITKFVNRKNLLRLGGGLEHMITERWGVRASLIWENTARLQMPAQNPTQTGLVKPKNSLIYGFGAFVRF